MFNLIVLGKTWDTTWKILLVIFLVVVAFFIIFGLIGRLIEVIMQKQGKAVDRDMANLIVSKVIDDKETFKKVATYKSKVRFFKASILPLSLLLTSFLIWIIYASIIKDYSQSIFDSETGIGSLFYKLDWSSLKYYPPFGINWDELVWIKPEIFLDARMTNYFIALFLLSGSIIYLIDVQAFIARELRIRKLTKTIFTVDLSKIDLQTFYSTQIRDVNPNK